MIYNFIPRIIFAIKEKMDFKPERYFAETYKNIIGGRTLIFTFQKISEPFSIRCGSAFQYILVTLKVNK